MNPKFIRERVREIQKENPKVGYLAAMQMAYDEWYEISWGMNTSLNAIDTRPWMPTEFDRAFCKYHRIALD